MITDPFLSRQHTEIDGWHTTRNELPLTRTDSASTCGVWAVILTSAAVIVALFLLLDAARSPLYAAQHPQDAVDVR